MALCLSLMFCDCFYEILSFIFEFVFFKWSLMKQWNVCWWLGVPAHKRAHFNPPTWDGLSATDSSTFWHLKPCSASPSCLYTGTAAALWPLLNLGTRKVELELTCLTLPWDRACTPEWHPHTLGWLGLLPSLDSGSECLLVAEVVVWGRGITHQLGT